MTTSVKSSLKQLSSASQALNEVSDQLSVQLTEIEKAVNRYNLGVTARVELLSRDESDPRDPQTWTKVDELHYKKLNGKWGLVWVSYIDEDPEGTWEEKFLRESPREIRLLAAKKLPELISELVKKANDLAADTAKRASEASELADALKE
jgi:uncharacterized phage infection (PIP) family protein YhgE